MKSKDPILSHHFYRKCGANARKLTSSDEVKITLISYTYFVTEQVSKMVPSNLKDDKEYWYFDTFEHGDDKESVEIKKKLEEYFEKHCQQ